MGKIEVIAEIGICHNGDMHLARLLIRKAKECGCGTVKFQVYSVDSLFPDKEIIAQGKNWYEEVKKTELTKSQVIDLADYCAKMQIEFFASAFDTERLGWLEEIGVVRHKVATKLNKDKIYINAVLATGKEVLISTDGGPRYHPQSTDSPYYTSCNNRIRWLYCIPKYPTPLEKLHLQAVPFNYYSGFSDHTQGIEAAMVAISRGAKIIERHFTLNKRSLEGPDHICSSEPKEMKKLVEFARKVERIL